MNWEIGENECFDREICIYLALTIGMDLMYKFHIAGQERLVIGAKVRSEFYYEVFCLGKEHRN